MSSDLLAKGRDKGYVLTEDVVALFPKAEDNIEGLDQFYSNLMSEGIDVVDTVPSGPPARKKRSNRAPIP